MYLPVNTAAPGRTPPGHRPGANLFAESLVAPGLATGEQVRYFQIVHTDAGTTTCPPPGT